MGFELMPHSSGEAWGPLADEQLIERAARTGPVAMMWQSGQGLVVPRTYRRYADFDAACERFGREGWPVSVRLSGGGIVPQGPGILNLSLAWQAEGKPLDGSDEAYLLLCRILADAIRPFGIDSHPAPVAGSFCDGRFNLAIGAAARVRKVAGTAQLWRRVPGATADGQTVQVVMAHALVLAQVDVAAVTARANLFESLLGSGKQYLPERAASLSDLCDPDAGDDFMSRLQVSIAREIAQASPAR